MIATIFNMFMDIVNIITPYLGGGLLGTVLSIPLVLGVLVGLIGVAFMVLKSMFDLGKLIVAICTILVGGWLICMLMARIVG